MAKNIVAEIRKATRRKFNAEDKIRIVLEGLRGQVSISELCRREGIAPTAYYRWSKDFLDAGKNGLTRDTLRDANTDEDDEGNCDVIRAHADCPCDGLHTVRSRSERQMRSCDHGFD